MIVTRISEKVMLKVIMNLNQILWNDRFSAITNLLGFGIDPLLVLDPRWIFHFSNMESYGVLDRITQKVADECS